MTLEFSNQVFSVSTVKGSRDEKDRQYYSVNIIFKSQKELEEHAVAHVKWSAQNKVRERQEMEAGTKKRPKNYAPYPLQPVERFEGDKMPDNWNPEATATIDANGDVQKDLAAQVEEMSALLDNLKKTNPALFEAMVAKFQTKEV